MTSHDRALPKALHASVRLEPLRQNIRASLAIGAAVTWDSDQVKRDGRKRNKSRAAALTREGSDLDIVVDRDAPAT